LCGRSLPALYSLFFVGVFFSVALAGAAAEAIDGGEPSFSDGVDVAWTRLGGIAGWAGYSLFVALVLELVKSIKGLRWLGVAAQVAWELRNDLCRPADRARRFRLSERRSALVPARKGELARRVRRTRRLAGDAPPTWAAVLPGWEAAFRRACALTRRKALLGTVLLCGFGASRQRVRRPERFGRAGQKFGNSSARALRPVDEERAVCGLFGSSWVGLEPTTLRITVACC
jgi:hypothetical protein